MFRKTIPLILTFVTGIFAIVLYFFQMAPFPTLELHLTRWIMIITAFSIILGVASLLKVNMLKVSKGHRDSFFSFILLVGFISTAAFGILGGVSQQDVFNVNEAIKADTVKVLDNAGKEVGVFPLKDAMAKAKAAGFNLVEIKPTNNPPVCKFDNDYKPNWNDIFKNKCYYIFSHIIRPMQSTMFSLLAFFVASAAFRAFRVKNFEATVLLIAAFLVMLGRVPIGAWIWPGFTVISAWIMENVNMAGSRAITLGTAVGMIAVSLKIMLGIERGYMGGSD
jgi:lysylphosphatidylglycerol synthetase-like protein (DUF2156 family)